MDFKRVGKDTPTTKKVGDSFKRNIPGMKVEGYTLEEGRKKKKRLFNLQAMGDIVDNDAFLSKQYDKLAINGEDQFG